MNFSRSYQCVNLKSQSFGGMIPSQRMALERNQIDHSDFPPQPWVSFRKPNHLYSHYTSSATRNVRFSVVSWISPFAPVSCKHLCWSEEIIDHQEGSHLSSDIPFQWAPLMHTSQATISINLCGKYMPFLFCSFILG